MARTKPEKAVCPRCGLHLASKSSLNKHLARKTPCEPAPRAGEGTTSGALTAEEEPAK